ncbi:MAG: prephenate dehydratase [Desulfobacteraceae bacterium]|nr:prephenate dehydratase [Desulfobacteraceae bacterium]
MENSDKTKSEEIQADDSDYRINKLRKDIDDIDNNIISLINQRLVFATDIGKIKAQKGRQVLDSTREIEVLQRLSSMNKGPLSKNGLRRIFTEIISTSREQQRTHVVTYLGPEATFTHIAAMDHFGRFVSFVPQASIRDVFVEVEKKACDYGVVPVENSIEGAVNHTLDLFFESDLKICAEKYQPISHDLLAKQGTLKDIRMVYSHPQPFAQCRRWLQKYLPEAQLIECSSTAHAAKLALEKPGTAAIASSEAANIYKLEVVASRIEDVSRNTTRFLIIGRDDIPRTGNDKTSLMFVTAHFPGALYKVLQPIAESGVNMLKLESRPTRHENWSYFFFVDVEGHMEDDNVKEAISKMKDICLYLKCLGSYPKAAEN